MIYDKKDYTFVKKDYTFVKKDYTFVKKDYTSWQKRLYNCILSIVYSWKWTFEVRYDVNKLINRHNLPFILKEHSNITQN